MQFFTGDKLVFVRCLQFVVSKFACGAVRMHACSMHSNAPGKSGQQWSLGRLTGRWLFVVIYSYFEKGCGKNVHATIPKGNMGYDQYTVPDDCSCRSYLCCFLLALANTFPWPFVPIPSNFFEKRELKTTHSAFQDCRVLFSRQPFSKQLYTNYYAACPPFLYEFITALVVC